MKKIILIFMSIILCFGLAACNSNDNSENDEPKEVSITDCVDRYEVTAVENNVIYWTVYFNDDFNEQSFSGLDFCDVIDVCLAKDESNDASITDYSIVAYDNNNTQRFLWGYPDSYEPIHEWDENGQAISQEYKYSPNM